MAIYHETFAPDWRGLRSDTFADLLDYIAANRCPYGEGSSQRFNSTGWFGTSTFSEAMDLARFGWPEGRRKMAGLVAQGSLMQQPAPVMAYDYDIGGAFPDVGLYCAGDPCHMVTATPESTATRPIYRFVINPSLSGGVEPSEVFNRGAAILTCAAKLEAEGARVELVLLRSATKEGKTFSFTFRIKAADENLDVDKAAFILAHAAMLRRISWAVTERTPVVAWWFKDNLIPSDKEPESWKTENSVYFGAMRSGRGFETIAAGIATVEATIKAGINRGE